MLAYPKALISQQQPIRHHFIFQNLPFELKASELRASKSSSGQICNQIANLSRKQVFIRKFVL